MEMFHSPRIKHTKAPERLGRPQLRGPAAAAIGDHEEAQQAGEDRRAVGRGGGGGEPQHVGLHEAAAAASRHCSQHRRI